MDFTGQRHSATTEPVDDHEIPGGSPVAIT
jgi:hypothetical protein